MQNIHTHNNIISHLMMFTEIRIKHQTDRDRAMGRQRYKYIFIINNINLFRLSNILVNSNLKMPNPSIGRQWKMISPISFTNNNNNNNHIDDVYHAMKSFRTRDINNKFFFFLIEKINKIQNKTRAIVFHHKMCLNSLNF